MGMEMEKQKEKAKGDGYGIITIGLYPLLKSATVAFPFSIWNSDLG
jgi:nitrate reductase NapE component